MKMKHLLRIEEFFLFLFSIYLFTLLDFKWWLFPLFFLIPDLGMLGYAVNKKIGAIIYNVVHHRAISIIFYVIGAILQNQILQFIGIILFAHSSLDRAFDYGLKYADDFKHTHLSQDKPEPGRNSE